MSDPACRCDVFVHPAVIENPAGRSSILYRIGDYTTFRHALLLSLPQENELTQWKPSATADLALQMIEWWAYLADILTFYNQRIANQDYLRTADQAQSVERLIRLLGYRPQPGIGATATLAALVSSKQPIMLSQGFAIQSKPGPGKQPQIFELDTQAALLPGGDVSADPVPATSTLGADGSILLKGNISSIKTGDQLLIAERGWNGASKSYAVAYVVSSQPEISPRGAKNTRVKFSAPLGLPSGAAEADYRVLRSTQTTRLYQQKGSMSSILSSANGKGTAHLDSIVRQIPPGDMILFDDTGGAGSGVTSVPASTSILTSIAQGSFYQSSAFDIFSLPATPQVESFQVESLQFQETVVSGQQIILNPAPALLLSCVTAYQEVTWYANSGKTNPPDTPPSGTTPGIAVLHSQITFTPSYEGSVSRSVLVLRHGWQEAGQLLPTPATTFTGTPAELIAVKPPNFLAGSGHVLIADANGVGESADGFTASMDTTAIQVSNLRPDPPPAMTAPLDVYYNLLPVSRGKTVTNEVLGSGDAAQAGQEFTLSKSPLTYLLSPDPGSGANYKSTLRVWVNGVEWSEAPSFFGQLPAATIFVTREDENNQTHVQFGDGVNGARLPSGTNNVIANYRFGSGADAPAAGTLTVIAKAQPGLSAIRNPVAAGGGADPEPPSQIRKYAPRSVLTFGRAVSGDDYEAIAASTPGVARARAYWSFDPLQQRTLVTVYAGDGEAARSAAELALRGDADPNRPVSVKLAQPVSVQLTLTLVVDAKYIPADVVAAAQQALLDPDTGLFGVNRIGVGEAIYASRIYAACFTVPGARAVHHLTVETGSQGGAVFHPLLKFQATKFAWSKLVWAGGLHLIDPGFFHPFEPVPGYRFDPGEGGYFSLDPAALTITSEVTSHAG